ncbi:hypothetical protein EHI47_37790 [Rhizobium leguminosarum]|uniref:Uncharacterized protein n=1 Tax=Rhizobium leguminosarum TaxID=384 RepID=A0A444HHW2_RHILE|nr:hypothetical protein EHI47_37790 [Rhizobium leguminosarum]
MTMTARQQLKRRDWPAAFFRSLGHASWAAEQTAAGINFLGGRRQTIEVPLQADRPQGLQASCDQLHRRRQRSISGTARDVSKTPSLSSWAIWL